MRLQDLPPGAEIISAEYDPECQEIVLTVRMPGAVDYIKVDFTVGSGETGTGEGQ